MLSLVLIRNLDQSQHRFSLCPIVSWKIISLRAKFLWRLIHSSLTADVFWMGPQFLSTFVSPLGQFELRSLVAELRRRAKERERDRDRMRMLFRGKSYEIWWPSPWKSSSVISATFFLVETVIKSLKNKICHIWFDSTWLYFPLWCHKKAYSTA